MDTKKQQVKLTHPIQKQVKAVAHALQKRGILIHQMYVFGSFTHGLPHKDSDIDVCIVSDGFGKDYHKETIMLQQLVESFDRPMDIIPYHPRDFANRYDPLIKEIHTHGIRIV